MNKENIVIALAAFIIAVLLRLSLQPFFSPGKEREYQVDFAIENLPRGLTVVNKPATYAIVASGATEDLDDVDTKTIKVVANLSRAQAGTSIYVVQIQAPRINRVDIRPRNFRVKLELQQSKGVSRKVELEPSGLPPAEFVYDGATILPASVTVWGPEKRIGQVARVRVSFDLGQVRPTATYVLPVEVLDSDGRPLSEFRAEPAEVVVSPAVAAAQAAKRLLVNPVWKNSLPFGYKVTSFKVDPVQVMVRGDSSTLAGITTIDTEPIDLAGIRETAQREVSIKLPANVELSGSKQVSVTIEVHKASGDHGP